jgi:preprotein translocase subunit SecG
MSDNNNQVAPNSNLSVIALVLSFVFPIAGLIVSIFARKEIRESNGQKGGDQLAKTAFILSIVFLVIQVLVIIFWSVAYFQAVQDANNIQNELDNYFDNLETPEVCWDPYWEEYTEEACY